MSEQQCIYCGEPKGERLSCCGENHWEDVEDEQEIVAYGGEQPTFDPAKHHAEVSQRLWDEGTKTDQERIDRLTSELAAAKAREEEANYNVQKVIRQRDLWDRTCQELRAEVERLRKDAERYPKDHPRAPGEDRDEIELFLRDAFAAGALAAQNRSLLVAMDYAKIHAPALRAAIGKEG